MSLGRCQSIGSKKARSQEKQMPLCTCKSRESCFTWTWVMSVTLLLIHIPRELHGAVSTCGTIWNYSRIAAYQTGMCKMLGLLDT